VANKWDPAQYEKFRAERMAPFFDLVSWIRARPNMRAIDLGAGTGEMTCALAERLGGATVEGVDSSEAMLAAAKPRESPWVSFRRADVQSLDDYSQYDLIFSNALLHWIPDNERLMIAILDSMKPGAQIAVQLPDNEPHASHRVAVEVASDPEMAKLLGGFVQHSGALPVEKYAELMHAHGIVEQQCVEKVYGHLLPSAADVVEWVKGTLLTAYLSRLDPLGQATFLASYKSRLLSAVGEVRPYFYTYRRILFWGVKG
jgi:trans-aconitate 2-methyltransferase